MWSVIGHQRVVNFLESQIRNSSVFHAYLFIGPKSVGKFTLAKLFAQTLLKAEDSAKLKYHPDFLLVENRNSPVSIETVRQIERKLSFSPSYSKKKVVVFEEAAFLTLEAQNALLKTLEEPPKHSVIILVSQRENFLPTILSRCVGVYFQPIPQKEIEKAGFSPFLAHISQGQIGRLFTDPMYEKKWEKSLNELAVFPHLSLKEKMDYTKNLSEEDLLRWTAIFKDVLYFKINPSLLDVYPLNLLEKISQIAKIFEVKHLCAFLKKLQETEYLFSTSVNQRLLLESLALQL